MSAIDFREMHAEAPDLEEVRGEYAAIRGQLGRAADDKGRLDAIRRWNDLRAAQETWSSLVQLHFSQDTRDPERKRARERHDELMPKLTELELDLMRELVASPHRAELEQHLGRHVFALWECAVTTYDPAIEQQKVQESKLEADYTELVASAKLEFRGETLTLPELRKYAEDPDREVRHDAERVRWGWFGESAAELDRIYDELVRLRTEMARTLGMRDFVELAYKRMLRTDYGREDVERFRAGVRDEVVPLCVELRRRQAERLGVDHLREWDELVHDPRGNPRPQGDHDWMVERAARMFHRMGGGLGEFYELMVAGHLLDLKSRAGKAGGGFCTGFPSYGVPFIFANFNGTRGDVEVFTHEMGHAFQSYASRERFPVDVLWPTAEACEIHSMSLEFLTWPYLDEFFGAEEAERFRRLHLTEGLLFLPYGVAVDHFQHLVYERPEASPAERLAMWQEMERTYLPWTDYGDLERLRQGARWQSQLHLYVHPFYYVDYALAQICALQLWVRASEDFDETLRSYVALCGRGGEAPFQELARGAGLVSPFDEGCLTAVVGQARSVLGV